MAVKINFDSANNVEQPTFILAHRNGDKMGVIPAVNIVFKDNMTSGSELSFRVYKNDNDSVFELWDELKDFKLVYCPEWNIWFEISVELEETNDLIKNVQGKSLGESELSQIMIYDIEINTEDDIDNDVFTEYGKAILYSENPKISMLNRLMDDKASHYHIGHIDNSLINETISNLKTFTFDNKSLYDCLLEIAEELNALLVIDSSTVTNDVERLGEISRTISFYDLETYCNYCHYRGDYSEFVDANGNLVCPKCSHTDGESYVVKGYGDFTTIYVSTENLSDEINYTTDKDSVKNCFKLEAGDDYLTATVKNCNPNGSQYIWYISDETKDDMSSGLVSVLNQYDTLFNKHQSLTSNDKNNYAINVLAYNELVKKYSVQPYTGHTLAEVLADSSLLRYPLLSNPTIGFPKLMEAKYNAMDFKTYLEHSLMPSIEMEQTSAVNERNKLQDELIINGAPSYTIESGKALSIMNYSTYTSQKTVENTVSSAVKLLVNPNYKFTLNTSSTTYNDTLKTGSWTGTITVERYYEDENDPPATTSSITVEINNNNEKYFKQLIDKKLNNASSDKSYDMVSLFELSITDGTGGQASSSSFANELKKYSLTSLTAFRTAGEACLNILIEQGVSNPENWNDITDPNGNLYNEMYTPYKTKLTLIDNEIAVRENEITIIDTLLNESNTIIESVNNELDFKTNIGQYWTEFCSYRREDTYSNSNYISDGLNDAEVFARALEFLNIAKKEIVKSATLQHSISSTLHNLLTIKEFQPLVNYFQTGNWIQVEIDGRLYKLRMIEYEIDFDNLDKISVDFSDVTQIANGYTDIESVLNSAAVMSSSYSTVSRQASKGSNSNDMLAGWFDDGLEVTNVKIKSDSVDQTQSWDENGMLFRRYIPETEDYDKVQMKIINTTLAITPDNWETVKAAVGKFRYRDITDGGNWKDGYGINGEVVVGKLIIGEELGIYNSGNTLSFNQNGLKVSGIKNEVLFTPSNTSTSVITITNKTSGNTIFGFDTNGNLSVTGSIYAGGGTIGGWTIDTSRVYDSTSSANTVGINKYGSGMAFFAGTTLSDLAGNSAKFKVDHAGNLTATSATISGTITAGSGSNIGGWTITSGKIYYNGTPTAVMQHPSDSTTFVFAAGGNSNSSYADCPFRVTKAGKLYASNIEVSGGQININNAFKVYSNGNLYGKAAYFGSTFGEAGVTIRYNTANMVDCILPINSGGDDGISTGLIGTYHETWEKGHFNDVTIYGSLDDRSDRKSKNHIEYISEISSFEDFIMGLEPVVFTYRDGHSGRHHLGLYAQDVAKIAKLTVGDLSLFKAYKPIRIANENGTYESTQEYFNEDMPDEELFWTLNYIELIPPMISVLQKAIKRVEQLELKIQELKEN